MTWFRVKEDSKLFAKLEKLVEAFQDVGLSLIFEGPVMLIDVQSGKKYDFLDLETNVERLFQGGGYVGEFPPQMEYKLYREEEK